MQIKLKKFLCTMLVSLICMSTFCTYVNAAETKSVTVNAVKPTSTVVPYGQTLISDAGIISNETKFYTITVPETATYTFTMSVKTSNCNGVWTILQKQGAGATIDQNILGSYQKRYRLTSGTWYLQLACPSGTCSFAVSIH
jgi:hypothetical protein